MYTLLINLSRTSSVFLAGISPREDLWFAHLFHYFPFLLLQGWVILVILFYCYHGWTSLLSLMVVCKCLQKTSSVHALDPQRIWSSTDQLIDAKTVTSNLPPLTLPLSCHFWHWIRSSKRNQVQSGHHLHQNSTEPDFFVINLTLLVMWRICSSISIWIWQNDEAGLLNTPHLLEILHWAHSDLQLTLYQMVPW